LQHLEATEVGKVEIQENQLGRLLQNRAQPFLGIGSAAQGVSRRLEMQPEKVPKGGIVLDRENPSQNTSRGSSTRFTLSD
jgi:hypothetical protein